MELRLVKTIAAFIALAGPLSASLVNYNPKPVTDTGWHSCGTVYYASLAGDFCRTTAFFEPDSLTTEFKNPPPGPISVVFQAAFDAWNTRDNVSYNPPGVQKGWTLSFGGDPGGTFDVSVAQAQQFDENRNPINNNVITGGLTIEVTPNAALRTALATAAANANANAATGKKDYQVVWAQGLFDNFMFNPTRTVAPFYEMDVNDANAMVATSDPSYCVSFPAGCGANNSFSDVPNLRYFPLGQTQGFFRGNAYFAIESIQNKSLIVYDGIDYGWDNFVSTPEPVTWSLLAVGLPFMAWLCRRRKRAYLIGPPTVAEPVPLQPVAP